MNIRRGMFRLGLGLAILWFVFWTFAYVLVAPISEASGPLYPAMTTPTLLAVIAVALVLVPWIVFGFGPH